MKRISFNLRFVNEAGNDLIPGKIHTIRQNYDYWEKFEGRELALFTWEGKPYRSKQKVFCVKRLVSVQSLIFQGGIFSPDMGWNSSIADHRKIAKNDGFEYFRDFLKWFEDGKYKPGRMGILHFTDFKY